MASATSMPPVTSAVTEAGLVRPEAVRPGEPVLSARDLLIGYGGHPLCPPVSFELAPGRALFVVGVNGAGKSTFMRTCIGLQESLGGSALLLGERPDPRSGSQRAAVARDLGEQSFFPGLSAREHLELVAVGHGVSRVQTLVEEVMGELGIDAVAEAVPDRLSSGQRRRLVLASVLVRPRSLLVLDEPEQRLDLGARGWLAGRLVAEREAGGSLLVASHDPDLVEACADAVLLVGHDVRLLPVQEAMAAWGETGDDES